MLFNKSNEQCLGIKGFEPLNIRTKNEGLTNLAIFQKIAYYRIKFKKPTYKNPKSMF